jgi:LytS/YehU family sensor histidine kinase
VLLVLTAISYRVGYDLRRWYVIVPVHVGLAFVFGIAARPLLIIAKAFVEDIPIAESFEIMDGHARNFGVVLKLYASMAVQDGMHYLVLQGLMAGLTFYNRYRHEQALRAEALAQYERARLSALRMQISPHFLYNTLSAIAGLVRVNPTAAEGMVTRLGDLFRRALAERETELVTLEQEIEYAESYLEIQRMRFEERLTFSIDVDPAARTAQVPPLLLQPLLENAVEHGLRASEGALAIELVCKAANGRIEIFLRNRSRGVLLPTSTRGTPRGLGLANVRERLEAAYPDGAEFEFQCTRPGEFETRLTFPSRTPAGAPAADEVMHEDDPHADRRGRSAGEAVAAQLVRQAP